MASNFTLQEQIERSVKMAIAYLRRAESAIHWTERRPIDVAYWRLLEQALSTAAEIVKALPDSYFEDDVSDDFFGLGIGGTPFNMSDGPVELADKVVALLKDRRVDVVLLRKIRALENTTGRTPEEAKLYLAKAAELRSQLR